MASIVSTTTEELLAMPDDGCDRWLIAGELKERPMTKRNRFHSRVMVRLSRLLDQWLDTQPEPRGEILCGEAGVRLRRNPDTTVGVDVAYVSAETLARQTTDSTIIEGVPTLIVEILSPSDTIEDVNEKIDTYLATGVALVWIVDPHRHTVTIHRPAAEPELLNIRQTLSANPQLPGFQAAVSEFFR